jgi:hypothetical protein
MPQNNNNENIENQEDNIQQPSVEELIQKTNFYENEIQKLKSENEKMNNKNKQLLTEFKNTESVLKKFEQKFEDEEERELLKKGDFETILSKKELKIKSQYENALNEKDGLNKQLAEQNKELQRILFKKDFDIQVNTTLNQVKDLQEGAADTLKILIERESKLDENGELVFFDSEGNTRTIVKNNKAVKFSVEDFVAEKRKQKPFLFLAVNGNESKSGNKSFQGKTVMTEAEFNKKVRELSRENKNQEIAKLSKAVQTGEIILEK